MKRAIRTGERRYAGLLLHERRADRRARLAAAGLDLYGTTGYDATTIPMLCSAAGVTSRHFYEEFGSREALLREVYDTIWHAVFAAVRAALKDRSIAGVERIRAANRAYFRYLMDDPRRARIYTLESMGVSAELERHRNAMREAFIVLITPAQELVEPPLDGRLLSAAVTGAAQMLLLEWVQAVAKPDVEAMVETLTQIWIRTLKLPKER